MPGILDFLTGGGGVLGGQAQPQPRLPIPQDDPITAGFANLTSSGGGLAQRLFNAVQGFQTGQRMDPYGAHLQIANATYQALLDNKVPEAQARLAAFDPDAQKMVLGRLFPTYKPWNVGNTAGSFNEASGNYRPQYIAPEFKTVPAGDTGISYQPPLPGYGQGFSQAPTPQQARTQPAPIQRTPLAPPPGAAGPMQLPGSPASGLGGAAPGPGAYGTQVVVPGMTLQQKAAAEAQGKAQGEGAAALGQARTNFDAMLKNIEELQTHPGLNDATGRFVGRFPVGKTEDAQNFINQEAQLKGQVAGIIAQARTSNSRALGALADQIQAGIAGLDRTSSTPDYSKSLDKLHDLITQYKQNAIDLAAGKPIDTTNTTPARLSAAERYQQLSAAGKTGRAAFEIMKREGYR